MRAILLGLLLAAGIAHGAIVAPDAKEAAQDDQGRLWFGVPVDPVSLGGQYLIDSQTIHAYYVGYYTPIANPTFILGSFTPQGVQREDMLTFLDEACISCTWLPPLTPISLPDDSPLWPPYFRIIPTDNPANAAAEPGSLALCLVAVGLLLLAPGSRSVRRR